MAVLLIAYASDDGQTEQVALKMADTLSHQGHRPLVREAKGDLHPEIEEADGVLLGGSVHFGRHQRALERFALRHAQALKSKPLAFFSVSLAAAGSDTDIKAARLWADRFLRRTPLSPNMLLLVGGALRYSRYGWWKRRLMKKIAARVGLPTNTEEDHEFTDWGAVRSFTLDFAHLLVPAPPPELLTAPRTALKYTEESRP